MMTNKENLKLLQTAVKVKAYIEGLELINDVDGLTVVRLVTMAFERKHNREREIIKATLKKDLEAYEDSIAFANIAQ
jgi:hypothetical protein